MKAQVGKLKSRQGILAMALLVGTIVAFGVTIQNATNFGGWSNAVYHTTINVTSVTWEANPTNTSITITVQLLAINPTATRLALFSAGYKIYLNGQVLSSSGSAALNPPVEAYMGHNVPFTSTLTISNNSEPQDVSYILSQTGYDWYISGTANFHSLYSDVKMAFTGSYVS